MNWPESPSTVVTPITLHGATRASSHLLRGRDHRDRHLPVPCGDLCLSDCLDCARIGGHCVQRRHRSGPNERLASEEVARRAATLARMLRTVEITRYVTPLREGSSLPALVEADDEREYVIKFRGAGHGEKALIAELVAGEIGRALGLPVPEIVLATLPEAIGRAESHDEIRDLLGWSIGLNIGLSFIPAALAPDLARPPIEGPEWAAQVVWFDDLVVNPDRTPRNANLIVHGG